MTQSSTHYSKAVWALFLAAAAIRFSIAWMNPGHANDSHLEVVKIIQSERRLPLPGDCWESFQPKLYHVFTAQVISFFERFFKNVSAPRIAQLLNVTAGMFTLMILLLFLEKTVSSEWIRVLTLALCAFNPEIVVMDVQATNDAFVVLFSSAAVYSAFLYFQRQRKRDAFFMISFTTLAGLTKGNALAFFAGFGCIFLILTIQGIRLKWPPVRRCIVAGALLTVVFVPTVGLLGQYVEKIERGIAPFAVKPSYAPPPSFFKKSNYYRPGIRSVVDGYFTFRWLDLFKDPAVRDFENGEPPAFRTSFWTLLFARLNVIHSPTKWASFDSTALAAARTAFVFALAPFFLLGWGVWASVVKWKNAFADQRAFESFVHEGVYWDVLAAFFILFLIAYSFKLRDFSSVKTLFLFPALLPFARLFAEGVSAGERALGARLILGVKLSLVILWWVYVWTLFLLIQRLTYLTLC